MSGPSNATIEGEQSVSRWPAATCGRRAAGFSYAEILIATALIAIALVPLIEGLSIGLEAGRSHSLLVQQHYHLLGKFEEVLAEPYDSLAASAAAAGSASVPSSYSDAAGSVGRRLVYLADYDVANADGDGDPLTGGDGSVLWVQVIVAGTEARLETTTWR